jgi:hypothetical protein
LPSNNKVALIQGLAGVECAAVASAIKDMGAVWNRLGALLDASQNDGGRFVHRSNTGTCVGNFIALSGEYKIFAGTDCLP